MHVLMLTREYPPAVYGGAGVVVAELSRALSRRARVEVRCWGDQDERGPALRVRGYQPWADLRVPAPFRHGPALAALSVDLAMAAEAVEADLVHSHTWYAAWAGLLVQALYDRPLVVTLHSLEPLRPWKADQLGGGYRVSAWVEQLAVERAARVIAVSRQMREDALAHFRVSPERVVVVGHGVDADAFRPVERREALPGYGVRPPYVLFVGRISEQKGIVHLLEAAAALPPEVQLVLCAASPDTPELLARLAAAVAGRPRIRWIPAMVPREHLAELYSHAALFVCPSVYEPFGLINLEAMACGAAVVASRVGGIPEVVADGETGVLVPPGDVPALAAALRSLLDAPERRRALGQAGRRRVEALFSWDRVAERTLEVYAEAIRDHRPDSSTVPSPR